MNFKEVLKIFGLDILLIVGIVGVVESLKPGDQLVWSLLGGGGIGFFVSIMWFRND